MFVVHISNEEPHVHLYGVSGHGDIEDEGKDFTMN
jgi:uncharacterized protein YsxB (DUF464 family)